MNISDIIALAKQGYKPSDIRDLMTLASETAQAETKEAEAPADVSAAETAEDTKEAPVDYESLYKAQTKELEQIRGELNTVKEDLKQAQKVNSNKDVSGIKPDYSPAQVWEQFLKER